MPSGGTASDGVVEHQNNDRSNHCDEQAIQVHARDSVRSKHSEKVTTDQRANNSQNYIEKYTLAGFVYKFAPQEPGNQAQHNPR